MSRSSDSPAASRTKQTISAADHAIRDYFIGSVVDHSTVAAPFS
jgi:hypothetical protein